MEGDGLADQLASIGLTLELRRGMGEALARQDPNDDRHSKSEANYTDGPAVNECDDCRNYTYGSCHIVRGAISAGGTCDYFTGKEQIKEGTDDAADVRAVQSPLD